MNFPTQWTVAQLGDLTIRIVGGGTPSKALSANFEGAIPFMTVKDMKARFVESTVDHISEEAIRGSATTMVPADTLIVATRMSLGKIVRPKLDVAINQDLKALFLEEEVEKTYIEYFWRSKSQAIQAMGTGTTVKGIRLEDIRTLAVPLAPKNEQKRIADKLDTVLARVDAVNTRLARVAPLLKRFRQSVLAAATSGRLTKDWRVAQGLNQGTEITLQAICMPDRAITYGVVKLGDETPTGTPCLRTSNVRWLRFDLDGIKRIHPKISVEYGRTVLRGGEVLVNVRGTLGGVAVATNCMAGWNVSREVAVVPVDQTLASPAYISLWIATDKCQRWLTGVAKGVAYTGINIEDLRTLPLELPLKEEQTEIVRRVEILFAFADRLEARLQAAQSAADRLTPSLLAKAFRGELVPQDPNDEPASELLMRLAKQEPTSNTKRPGRKVKST